MEPEPLQNEPGRGMQILTPEDEITFNSEDNNDYDVYRKSIPVPFGEFIFELKVPTDSVLNTISGNPPERIGDWPDLGINEAGEFVEMSNDELKKRGFAMSNFYVKTSLAAINRLTKVNFWVDRTKVFLHDNDFNWGKPEDDQTSVKEFDFTTWKNEEGEEIGTFFLIVNADFLQKLRISFESTSEGGDTIN